MLSLFEKLMTKVKPSSLTAKVMRDILLKVKMEFRTEKVRSGVLVAGAPGQHPCMNPSERRPGWVRFEKLVSDWKAWGECSKKLAMILSAKREIEIGTLLSELRNAKLKAYSGKSNDYASVRFVRMLVHSSSCTFADTNADWCILRGMTAHVKKVIISYGLQRHEDAVTMRDALRAEIPRIRGGYSLSDLVIYLCLLKNPGFTSY